jgi:heme A synthase
MSAYGITLFLHSWTRWALLLAAVLIIVQAFRGWSGTQVWDDGKAKLSAAFVHLSSLQLVLGLLLYGVFSPLTASAMSDMGAAMRDSTLRFWAVEHITMMTIAIALAHIGSGRIRKGADDKAKHRAAAIFFTLALVIMISSIPWDESARLIRGL